jgi:hypothetical protein
MTVFRVIIVAAAVAVCGSWASAQDVASHDVSPSFAGAARASDLSAASNSFGFSLLDPSRLNISHSYSMSYWSGGGQSRSVGLYMSTLEYQFCKPLSVRVGLGYLHQPLGFTGVSGPGGEFLPNVRLDWRPTDNMQFIIDYRTIPTSTYDRGYGYGFHSPYYRSLNPLWDW